MNYQHLADVLRRFAGTLLEDYSLAQAFEELSPHMCTVLDVHGAGVMLEDADGNLRFTSSSDPVLAELEELQIRLGEGPCLQAYRTGSPIEADHLETDPRFRTFGPRAVAVDMHAVYSYPMRRADTVIGAVNFYRRQSSPLSQEQRDAAQILADVATAYILHAREDDRSRVLTSQLQEALNSRIAIEQAKGFVSARLDLPVDESFHLLRSYARSHSTSLHEVARQVLAHRLLLAELHRPR